MWKFSYNYTLEESVGVVVVVRAGGVTFSVPLVRKTVVAVVDNG